MATVHLGASEADPQRLFAIKRLHPQFATDPYFARMLLDEAAIAARVRHPNVVATRGAEMVNGSLALVMDYAPGVSLAELIAAVSPAVVPPRIATAIIVDVLHGLHAAHETVDEAGAPLGIIHRDVSPNNIHVGVDGVGRVIDFGIAKAAHRLQATRAGWIKGRIAYMAPEQLRDDDVDRRVDVRAAAVVLWEALTSQPLFHDETPSATLKRVLEGATQRPGEIASGIPRELDAVIMRALASARADRFATALGMAKALEHALGQDKASASEVGAWVASVAAEPLRKRWNLRLRLVGTPVGAVNSPERDPSRDGITGEPAPGRDEMTVPFDYRDQPISAKLGHAVARARLLRIVLEVTVGLLLVAMAVALVVRSAR